MLRPRYLTQIKTHTDFILSLSLVLPVTQGEARLAPMDSRLGAAPEADREPPPLPPPMADGTRQVLVTIPRPLTASSDAHDDGLVKIPEFGVTIELPAWYREAQEELARAGPAWPPQAGKRALNISEPVVAHVILRFIYTCHMYINTI